MNLNNFKKLEIIMDTLIYKVEKIISKNEEIDNLESDTVRTLESFLLIYKNIKNLIKESKEQSLQEEPIINDFIDYFYLIFNDSVGIINTSYNEYIKL